MSRKSKKGFKRLENHELSEFTSLNPGESGSESELLDLTTVDEHETHGRDNSCCWWCSCLYLSLLSLLLLLVGASVGYLTWSLWQAQTQVDDRFNVAKSQMEELASKFDEHKTYESHRIVSIGESLRTAYDNMSQFEGSIERHFKEYRESISNLTRRVQQLEGRVAAIESQPRETLERQVDQIHTEMRVLNKSLAFLNHSLEDVQAIQVGMASVHSEISRYTSALNELRSEVGDLSDGFDVKVGGVRDSVTEEHDRMALTTNLLSEQVTVLQSAMTGFNDSVRSEFAELWSNVSQNTLGLQQLDRAVLSLNESLDALTEHIHTNPFTQPSTTEESPSTDATPPVTSPPPSLTTLTTTPPSTPPVTSPPPSPNTLTTTPPSTPPSPPPSTEDNTSVTTQGPSEPTTSVTDSTGSKSKPTGTEAPPNGPLVAGNEPTANVTEAVSVTATTIIATTVTPSPSNNAPVNGTNSSAAISGESGGGNNRTDSGNAVNTENSGGTEADAIDALNTLLDGFSEYDKDQDEFLSFEELQAVIPDSGAVFRMLDANSDRYLTVEEIEEMKQSLLAARAKESGAQTGGGEEGDETVPTGQPPVIEPLVEKEREAVSVLNSLLTDFATFDEDSDGYLSHTELQKHLPPTSSELLLRLFDDNKDDALTTQEIMALRDMIIDSMASDAAHSEVGGSDVTETPEDELYKYLHS